MGFFLSKRAFSPRLKPLVNHFMGEMLQIIIVVPVIDSSLNSFIEEPRVKWIIAALKQFQPLKNIIACAVYKSLDCCSGYLKCYVISKQK